MRITSSKNTETQKASRSKNSKASEGFSIIPPPYTVSFAKTQSSETLQTKLNIGRPGDKYEREADAMADRIMRMPEQVTNARPKNHASPNIQRKCAKCKEEEKEIAQKPLMLKSEGNAPVATSALSAQLARSKGSGASLPLATNAFMSRAFGTDFSHVRIRTGNKAAEMNRQLDAKAFTHGRDIYFNQGRYNPASQEGKRLLGHELTHVLQQGSEEMIQRQTKDKPNNSRKQKRSPFSFSHCNTGNNFKNYASPSKAFSDQPTPFRAMFIRQYGERKAGAIYHSLDGKSKRVLLGVYNKMVNYGLETFIDKVTKIDNQGAGSIAFVAKDAKMLIEQFVNFQLCKSYCLDDINVLHGEQKCFREMDHFSSLHLCIGGDNTFDAHVDQIPPAVKSSQKGACKNDFNGAVVHILNEAAPEVIAKGVGLEHPNIGILKILPNQNPTFDRSTFNPARASYLSSDPSFGQRQIDIVNVMEIKIGNNWNFELNYSYYGDPGDIDRIRSLRGR